MRLFKKIILLTFVFLSLFWNIDCWFAEEWFWNINVTIDSPNWWTERNIYLKDFWENEKEFFNIEENWWRWIFYTLVQIAHSLKNFLFYLATIFYLIIAIKLIIAENTEEQITKFKKWIVWITIWLIIMQIAFSFTISLYAKNIWESLAFDFISNIVNPLIWLLEVLASFFFIWVAIFSYYRLVTAWWNEEETKRAKMSIVYAIMWFILLKLAKIIVEWVYWKLECKAETIAWYDIVTTKCIWNARLDTVSDTFIQIINWMNWFIGIITILLIIYAWFIILFSSWEEEKVKKAKNTLIYIAIWLFLLVANYLILTFFFVPETTI
jgi:hypothetical protein